MGVPFAFSAADKSNREDHLLSVIARLKAGVTSKQAQAEMDTVAHRLALEYPKTDAGWSAPVRPFRGEEIQGFSPGRYFSRSWARSCSCS
jgi:hypothetical protein